MIPNATLDQKIATGFNRNHRANTEDGIIAEEYAVEYVVDRGGDHVNRVSRPYARLRALHNHKYDPFTQKEFYQVFSYFNTFRVGARDEVWELSTSGSSPHPRNSRPLCAMWKKRARHRRFPARPGFGEVESWDRASILDAYHRYRRSVSRSIPPPASRLWRTVAFEPGRIR